MRIIGKTGRDDIAMVYLAELRNEIFTEFVESIQPPLPREKKWVLIVSTLVGCPIGCQICDAGGWYKGRLSKDEIMAQIDFMVLRRFPDRRIPIEKFKIQFARMGEPSLNPHVLDVLNELPKRYQAPGLLPSLSTVAPNGTNAFFEGLLKVKNEHYANGKFQLQFSIHTTDNQLRDSLIPAKKWSFEKIAKYGARFLQPGEKKITLNFALGKNSPLDSEVLSKYFDPESFIVKLTPVNPTIKARENSIFGTIEPTSSKETKKITDDIRSKGYEVIVSIGELEENKIGSNCGQYVRAYLSNRSHENGAYEYQIENI